MLSKFANPMRVQARSFQSMTPALLAAKNGNPPGSVVKKGQFPNHPNDVNAVAQSSSSPVKNTDVDKMFNNARLKPRRVPIQLRQTGDGGDGGLNGEGSRFLVDTRLRKGPYWHLSQAAGSWCYSVYNKTYHPRAYIPKEEGGLMEEYKYLTEHVTMWNVAVERQIMVKGPDANNFVDYVTTRKPSAICPVGKCKYVIQTNNKGGILNDPILLHVKDDEWWFSIADSDMNLYLQGVNHDNRWDCEIAEIDVAPVQIQGPKAPALMADLFGADSPVTKMSYYDCVWEKINGVDCVISASGFSTELGYEIYLCDATPNAEKMWNKVLEVGKKHNLKVIAPGHHRRIEAGLMSYGADIDIECNPYECGMGWQVDLKRTDDFVGKDALAEIKKQGVSHKLAGLRIEGGDEMTWYNSDFLHVFSNGELVGYVTSCWYSPEQSSNIAMAMLPVDCTELGTKLEVALPNMYNQGKATHSCTVEKTPFKMPAQTHLGTGLRQTGSKL
jgi:aminomethyltransferase